MMYRYKVKHNPFRRLKMAFKSRKRTRGNIFLGVVTTILASLSFTAMSACAKALAPISSEEMTFFRGLVGLIFIPLLTLQTKEPFFTGKYKFMLSLRGFFGSAALLFYFLSIEGMTLGDSQILSQLAAFFMCILSPIFLKEKLPKEAIPGLVVIALGTLCVVQIWNFDSFNVYALFGIGGGFFSAAAYIVISMLAERDFKSNTEIVFYFQIFSIAVGAALMEGSFTMPEGIQWVWLIGLGLFALSAQMFMTWAFQHVNSLIVSFLMYSEILFHVLFGWYFWDEILTWASWLGGTLIVLGSIMLMVFKPKSIDNDTHHHEDRISKQKRKEERPAENIALDTERSI